MTYPKIELPGAVVAITGGARGIGRATAAAFVREGARVAIGDLDLELAEATARELGPSVRAYRLDVTDRDGFDRFLALIEDDLGPLDVLVNNAGVMPIAPFLEEPEKVSATTVNVNVWGPINGMRLALPGMVERGRGHVVNIASLAGKTYMPGLAVYCASKYAVVGLTATVRAEVESSGVSLSAVLPSMVKTELSAGIPVPGPAAVEPDDIAAAVVASVRTRRAEIPVPRWVGSATTVGNLLPKPLQRLVRRAIKDDRGLVANQSADRAAYLSRVDKQAVTQKPIHE